MYTTVSCVAYPSIRLDLHMTNTVFLHVRTDRTLQRLSEAKVGINDRFTLGIIALVDSIGHQLYDNRSTLNLADGFTEDDVIIKIDDGRKDHYSRVGDAYVELTATFMSNGEMARLTAADKLNKIVRRHLEKAGLKDDLRVSVNIIRAGFAV